MKKLMPKIAKMNITRKRRRQILNSAGMDMASANSNVRIPRAPFTNRSTRPILATRTTLRRVGETKYLSIRSLRRTPEMEKKHLKRESERKTLTQIHLVLSGEIVILSDLRWQLYLDIGPIRG